MKGYVHHRFWAAEKIGQHQWRVSVQGKDAEGKERCIAFLHHSFNAAAQEAAQYVRKFGLVADGRVARQAKAELLAHPTLSDSVKPLIASS